MIRINVKDTGITVSGHAQRLPGASPGHNIICAGVSALTGLLVGVLVVAGAGRRRLVLVSPFLASLLVSAVAAGLS